MRPRLTKAMMLCRYFDRSFHHFHKCFRSFHPQIPFLFTRFSLPLFPQHSDRFLLHMTYGWSKQTIAEVNTEVKVSPLAFLPEMEAERKKWASISEYRFNDTVSKYIVQDKPWVVGGAEIILWQSCMGCKELCECFITNCKILKNMFWSSGHLTFAHTTPCWPELRMLSTAFEGCPVVFSHVYHLMWT